MVLALAKEIEMRKSEFDGIVVESIYFGGGTPSQFPADDIRFLINAVFNNYTICANPEITLEANPDDLCFRDNFELSSRALSIHNFTTKSCRAQSRDIFEAYKSAGINRLSIGIQSFFEDDLQMMNRAHNATEAKDCLKIAVQYFDNISLDLIYGIPGMSNDKWTKNIETALSFGINHISSYALTVEPKTVLQKQIASKKIEAPKDEVAQEHFEILVTKLTDAGFIHYELSNFGREHYFSRNNSSYWLGKNYIGIGPSAHSFNGTSRSWNIANNAIYIKKINATELPSEKEMLSKSDLYNEYVMTGLRTIWGVSLSKIESDFGPEYHQYIVQQSKKHLTENLLYIENQILKPTAKGKFLTDGIASDLFKI